MNLLTPATTAAVTAPTISTAGLAAGPAHASTDGRYTAARADSTRGAHVATGKQRATARSDARALDTFFRTPGLND